MSLKNEKSDKIDALLVFLKTLESEFSEEDKKEEINNSCDDRKFCSKNDLDGFNVGKKVIIRTDTAGVWFGTLAEKCKNEVILEKARRMWSWQCANSISLSGVAVWGIVQDQSNICAPVESVWMEAIEIITLTKEAIKSIEECPVAVACRD